MHFTVATTCLLLLLLHCSWLCAGDYNPEQVNKTESELLGCLKTSNLDEIRKIRLNIFKQELLLRLNLDKEPENPSPEDVQRYKKELSNELIAVKASHQLGDKEIKPCVDVDKRISRLVVFFPNEVNTTGHKISSSEVDGNTATTEDSHNSLFDTLRFKFSVDLVGHQEVTEAELRLYKTVVADNTDSVQEERIDIYSIYRNVENYYNVDLKLIAAAGNVKTDKDGYTIFDVKDAINEWKERTNSVKGELVFQVEIRTKEKEGFSLPPKVQYASDNSTTQLVIRTLIDRPNQNENDPYSPPKVAKVEKRHAGSSNKIVNCALHPLVINFKEDFNWTWVLDPEVVTLNYCSGLCGRANAENLHTEYLSIRSTVLSNPVGATEPCCIPNSYETVTMLLAIPRSEKTTLEKVPELTIRSCVCR